MNARGFTLIELVIALVITGLLAMIAFPSFTAQAQKSRRADGKAALLAAAVQMERYYTEHNTYATAALGAGGVYPAVSDSGYYNLTLTNLAASTFTLDAAPTGAQTGDSCGTLTYTQQGTKGVTGSAPVATCW